MAIDFEVFDGKSLSDLFKDIYENTLTNKKQLEVLMQEVVGFIKDVIQLYKSFLCWKSI